MKFNCESLQNLIVPLLVTDPCCNWMAAEAKGRNRLCMTLLQRSIILVLGVIGSLAEAVVRAVLAIFTSFGLLGYFFGKSENKLYEFSVAMWSSVSESATSAFISLLLAFGKNHR